MTIIRFLRNPPKRLVFAAALFSLFGLVFAGTYYWTVRQHGHDTHRLGLQGIKAAYCEWKRDLGGSAQGGQDADEGGRPIETTLHYGGPEGYVRPAGPFFFPSTDDGLGLTGQWSDIGPESNSDLPPPWFGHGGDFFSLAMPGGVGGGGFGGGVSGGSGGNGAGGGGGGGANCKSKQGCQSLEDGENTNIVLADNTSGGTSITTPVPEPETYAMLLAGLGLMAATVRRRKHHA